MAKPNRGDTLAFVAREFERTDLGDERLRRRLVQIVVDLTEDPGRSIPQASGRWASTKGAYRFFSNPRVTREGVMKGHWEQTAERIQCQDAVLVVEDTTFLNFSHHPQTKGLGKIGNQRAANQLQGVLVHSALAVDVVNHQVLGLIGQEVIVRKEYQSSGESREARQVRSRESGKWMTSARGVIQRVGRADLLIFTFDREGDVFEVIEELQQRGARYVIRAAWNRRIAAEEAPPAYLLDQVHREPVLGEMGVDVAGNGTRTARRAPLKLRSGTYRLRPPKRSDRAQTVEIRMVSATEENPPAGVDPLEGMLLTTEPIQTAQDVQEVVRHYTGRWKIEEWHKVLKSGCRIQERELETWERLDSLLGILSILAWRLLSMRDAARISMACVGDHLSDSEQAVLKAMDPSLTKDSTLREYLRSIAKLGGFLARKRDGNPGWITLWRGSTASTTWIRASAWPALSNVGNGQGGRGRQEGEAIRP
jgi:Transposase DNA-binding/Transposase DDE domain